MPPNDAIVGGSTFKIYLSATIGAFMAIVADIARNSQLSTIKKLDSQIIRILEINTNCYCIIALFVILILGLMLCWIYQPTNKVDAFTRGLSVFVILTTTVPPVQQAPVDKQASIATTLSTTNRDLEQTLGDLLKITTLAYADDITGNGMAICVLEGNSNKPIMSQVTLTSVSTSEMVANEQLPGKRIIIRQPYGEYWMSISSPGFRYVKTRITLGEDVAGYKVDLTETNIPTAIQVIINPIEIVANPISSIEANVEIGKAYLLRHEYGEAIRYYNIALETCSQSQRVQISNYLGYALFRCGKLDDAEAILADLFTINQSCFNCWLNLVKVYCAGGKEKEAEQLLIYAKTFQPNEILSAVEDWELRRICPSIHSKIGTLQ